MIIRNGKERARLVRKLLNSVMQNLVARVKGLYIQ